MPRGQIPLQVHSHKRSGTHILMAEIWKNFQLPDMSKAVALRSRYGFSLNGVRYDPGQNIVIPWSLLFGSHKVWSKGQDMSRVVYVIRHPVSVLLSNWRFTGGSVASCLGEGSLTYWYNHASSYEGSYWVRYEDLTGENHDKVLAGLADKFGLKKKTDSFCRITENLGWYHSGVMTFEEPPMEEILSRFEKKFPNGVYGYEIRKYGKAYKDSVSSTAR